MNPNFNPPAMDTPSFFCYTATPTTEIYTLSLHDALPISVTITVTNTGSAALANCKVTDTNLTDRKSTRLNSSHLGNSYAVFCLKIIDLGVGAPAVTATGTITGLTQDSCNTVSVTCDIVGS